MKFTKMHGLGNDYVYIDAAQEPVADPAALAVRLSDRRFGVGSDGLILIKPSENADFSMDMYNADGSRAEMCGNGIRCVGKYVYDHGLTQKTELAVETLAGVLRLTLHVADGKAEAATVDMGVPELLPARVPVRLAGDSVISRPLVFSGREFQVTCVSMGNPHAVIFVEDAETVDLAGIGPVIERDAIFPNGVNVEFVQVRKDGLRMRVWERGSGITMACGTGACSALVAAHLNGHCGREAKLLLDGGSLDIRWREDGHVLMTGPAVHVYSGVLED